ncbi:uncharacterized protein LOC110649338 [Hevea brasiliensis]|uniref:uncharacterized protein LOC110649338 n=1 Tax=Hevea brasiliensis TaxID=3981 RepID=UPI0025CE2F45|nr:uncharacterized protein LOC110649338 [Hevea brasiliensis]
MKSKAPTETKLSLWATNVSSFFNLPNPRILTLFIISNIATFSLGTALLVQWILHGQYHPEYDWIVYYAPLMMAFVVFVLMICFISANFLNKKEQNVHSLSLCFEENVQSTSPLVQEVENELALSVVPSDHAHGNQPINLAAVEPTCTRLMLIAPQGSNVINKNSNLKRTFSLRLPINYIDYGMIKRSFSCRL